MKKLLLAAVAVLSLLSVNVFAESQPAEEAAAPAEQQVGAGEHQSPATDASTAEKKKTKKRHKKAEHKLEEKKLEKEEHHEHEHHEHDENHKPN
jgi:Skp family chaperone for outer membrane proteins